MAGPVAVGIGIVAVAAAIDQIFSAMSGRQASLAERTWLYSHPLTALAIRDCTMKAIRKEQSIFGENGEDDEGDAFRHCYWSALLTREIGQDRSGFFTSLHEEHDDNTPAASTMDLHNNGVGRWTYFPIPTDDAMANRCLKLLADGKLIVASPWPGKLAKAANLADLLDGHY